MREKRMIDSTSTRADTIRCWAVFAAGVSGILCLDRAPFLLRFAGVAGMGLGAVPYWWRRRAEGGGLASLAVAGAWITLGSYPAGMSFVPRVVWVALFAGLIVSPWLARTPRGGGRGRRAPMALLAVWVAFTPPARRFDTGNQHTDLARIAGELTSIEEAVAYVHETIERQKAPPTDTALDTLRRGRAHCGGMSNLLHALLREMGEEARIVHVRGDSPGHIHTLVEARVDGKRFLADPQENLFVPGGVEMLVTEAPGEEWPPVWRGMKKAYRHVPGQGYRPAGRVDRPDN